MARKLTPRREYDFNKMKPGDVKKVSIPAQDPRAGIRALTAAYQFARRRNVKVRRKAQHVIFAGRLSPTKKVMNIHRTQ